MFAAATARGAARSARVVSTKATTPCSAFLDLPSRRHPQGHPQGCPLAPPRAPSARFISIDSITVSGLEATAAQESAGTVIARWCKGGKVVYGSIGRRRRRRRRRCCGPHLLFLMPWPAYGGHHPPLTAPLPTTRSLTCVHRDTSRTCARGGHQRRIWVMPGEVAF